MPVVGALFQGPPFGIGVLTAGLILGVMILPFIASVSRQVFATMPPMLRDAAYGVGANTWEVSRHVLIPYARTGLLGGIMLGLGRALGETMAVTFVIGNAHKIGASLLAPGTTISATLANEFTEAVGDIYLSSLLALGLDPFPDHLRSLVPGSLYAQAHRVQGGRMKPDASLAIRRNLINRIATGLFFLSTIIAVGVLVLILGKLVLAGLSTFSLSIFTKGYSSAWRHRGSAKRNHRQRGDDLWLLFWPPHHLPFLAGTYLAEYGRRSRLGNVVRFLNDTLLSAPSIIIGLFVYGVMVIPAGHFSGWAGAASLALIALPVIVRTTEDMMRLIPDTLREAAVALGCPYWRMIVSIGWRAARPGIMTGILLAVARISGETAPLLFTALNNQFVSVNMNAPTASLPVVIFQFAMSPYKDWQNLAWAGALLITFSVLFLNIVARTIVSRGSR